MSLHTISWRDLQVGELIGHGSYGDVYCGTWNGKTIAIKKLLLKKLSDPLQQDFANETKIMAECQSERVIRLFAVCHEVGNYAMVMEYMEKGSLYQLLHDEKAEVPWSLRWRLATEIGEGLTYLHGKRILHRDLKSGNVLIDGALHAKISDFGLAKLKVETSSTSTKSKSGTARWQAPELFNMEDDPVPTQATDVYSYGMVLWEIAARKIPFSKAPNEMIAMHWISSGKQETLPTDCPEAYEQVLKKCWAFQAQARPSAAEAVEMLHKTMPQEKAARSWHFDIEGKSLTIPTGQKYVRFAATQKDFDRVVSFYSHHPVPGYEVGSVEVIHNPAFNRIFELQMGRLQERHGNQAFLAKWSKESQPSWRGKVRQIFEELAQPHGDPAYPNVKLLPAWHGTKPEILDSIFRAGYAALSTTDDGFFGKGLYFAHEAEYAHRVYGKGALLLNWIAVYSTYPVIDGDTPKLVGKAAYDNYDAHFVPVISNDLPPFNVNYFPCKPDQIHHYIEVVIFESAACLPRYLVTLQPTMTKQLAPKPDAIESLSKTAGSSFPSIAPQQTFSLPKPGIPSAHQKIFEAFEIKEYEVLAQLLYSEDPKLKQDRELADKFYKEGWGRLQLAVILGRLDIVQHHCLQKPSTVKELDSSQRSLLYIASGWGGHLEVVQWLVQQDRTLLQKVVTNLGWTPIHAAIYADHFEVAKWLVGEDRSLLHKAAVDGRTPLYWSAEEGKVKFNLFGFPEDLDITPLHVAAKAGYLAIVKWLVQQDPHLWQPNETYPNPVYLAAYAGHLEIVQWFVTTNPAVLQLGLDGFYGSSLLNTAVSAGHLHVVKWIAEQESSRLQKDNTSLLYTASDRGHLEVAKWLVEQDRSLLQQKGVNQATPLYAAAENGHLDVVTWLVEQDRSLLLKKGGLETTPLHAAAKDGRIEVVKWLAKQDRSLLQIVNDDGRTSLASAAFGGHLEIIQWLVQQDQSLLHRRDKHKSTPLHIAAWGDHLEVCKWLVAQDPSFLLAKDLNDDTPLHDAAVNSSLKVVQWIVQLNRSLLHYVNKKGETPVFVAAFRGRLDIIQWLVGQDRSLLQTKDSEGATLLYKATFYKNLELIQWLVQQDRSLLQIGDNNGNTPLHLAAWRDHLEICKWLVQQDHRLLTKKDNYGRTALDLAIKQKNSEVVVWLKQVTS